MEGVKDKYQEIKINDLSELKTIIEFKKDFFEKLLAAEYFYKKTNKPNNYLYGYIDVLKKMENKDFEGLHLCIIGSIKDWIYDSLDTDTCNLEDLQNEINKS